MSANEKEQFLQIQRTGKNGSIIKITPVIHSMQKGLVHSLYTTFENYLNKDYRYFIFDFSNFEDLSPDVIALMLELTSVIHRHRGELYVVNLSNMATEDMLTFNPVSYLAMPPSEDIALAEVENSIRELEEASVMPADEDGPESIEIELEERKFIEIPYERDYLYIACEFVVKHARQMGFREREVSRINIAVYEGVLNAIEHANTINSVKKIKIEVEKTSNVLQISVWDYGPGFDYETLQGFDVNQAVSHRNTGGMGLHIIRRAMDVVDYKSDQVYGNRLILTKYLKK